MIHAWPGGSMSFFKKTPFKSFMGLFLMVPLHLACSETPSATVEPVRGFQQTSLQPAAVYVGSVMRPAPLGGRLISTGQSCHINLSLREEEGESHLIAQMEERVHGQKTRAIELDPYYFNFENQTYGEAQAPDSVPTLAGAILREGVENLDINSLQEYVNSNSLIQSMELRLKETGNHSLLQETLQSINGEESFSFSQKEALDQLDTAFLAVVHGNHMDGLICMNLKLMEAPSLASFSFIIQEGEEEPHGHEHRGAHEDHEHHDEHDEHDHHH